MSWSLKLIRFLPSVSEAVLLEVTPSGECFITDATLICFLPSVGETVRLQGAAVREDFITDAI